VWELEESEWCRHCSCGAVGGSSGIDLSQSRSERACWREGWKKPLARVLGLPLHPLKVFFAGGRVVVFCVIA